ncbi:MAG: D-sedoheptulose 7-phosphate isomerase [Marinifilaceae bacterium]
MNKLIEKSFNDAINVLSAFVSDETNLKQVEQAGDMFVEAFEKGCKALSCGNGGSLCDAMHFAEELTGRFRGNRKALPAIAIADPSHMSCVANDFGYEDVFSRYVEALGNAGDVLLAISTSGNSANINKAITAAKEKGMRVVGLTGKTGGAMKEMCDVCIVVPWNEYSDRIQEVHIKIIHILIEYIEEKMLQ